ncbi:dipeptidase [Candidatus Poribacteria bacterium]
MERGTHDYIIAEGHQDIFELTIRRARGDKAPLRDGQLCRLLTAGVDVVFIIVGGDATHHRDGSERPLEGSLDVLDMFLLECEKAGDAASVVLSRADIPSEPDPDGFCFVMELEGGRPFQEDYSSGKGMLRKLANLRNFHRLGVRSVQLTHNGRNELGDGLIDRETGGRLSQYGVAVIREMNRLGMLIGVSHLSESGFYHALEVSEKPIVATHSNCRAVYDHPRSLTDDQIKAMASHGGVVGIQFLKLMLAELTLEHYLDHIDHACQLVGPEHVAATTHGFDPIFMEIFGSAFNRSIPEGQHNDGSAYKERLTQFIRGLEKRGYDQEEIAGILGHNLLSVLAQVLD